MREKRADPEQPLLDELRLLYAEVDALHAGSSCPATTECCRFGLTGREPYVTSIEVLAIERAVASSGGPLSPRRRALPLAGARRDEERTCPLLGEGGRCSIYAARPFGCRTFYCERAKRGGRASRALERDLARRLSGLAARHVPDGDRTRPLTRVFERGTRRGGA